MTQQPLFVPRALLNINVNRPKTSIKTGTGEINTSTGAAVLTIPAIPTLLAHSGHIMPGFTNNILSLGKRCDADFTATMDKHTLEVHEK